jgi:NADPH:quinone reductase-like Zn-dependent oxidoreductase
VRALVITKRGGPDVLRIEERPDLSPAPGQVRVAVRAAGVNFADLMARQGLYPDAPKLPAVVGYEFSGEVDAVGEGVDRPAVGDRVLGGCRFGGYAEQVVTDAGNVIPLPDGWSFEEGAALPVNYATAYAGLVRYGAVHEGERILLHAAAGGVGIAGTQIAGILGAEVYGTASAGKHDAVRGFGVAHPIDYRSTDFVKEVRRIGGRKRPLDLVMDAVGGNSFRKSFSLLDAGGRLVCFGASSLVSGDKRSIPTAVKGLLKTPIYSPMPLQASSRSVIGLNILRLWDAKGSLDEFLAPLEAWVREERVRPVVAEAFPLERGADAHRYLGEGRNIGKVVLSV